MTSLCEINIKKIIIKKSYTKIWPENLIQLFSYYFRIFCKKESEKVRVLTLTYFAVLLFHIQYNQLFPKYFANTKGSRTSFQATFFEALTHSQSPSINIMLHTQRVCVTSGPQSFSPFT